jgi:tetratricopeptide (TPR) repeat protein
MTTRTLATLAVLALPAICDARQAKNPYPDEAVVFEQMKTIIRFEPDGTGRREMSIRARAQSEAGVRQLGQLAFGYSAATERLDFPFVRVRKPDGSVVETPASAIQDLSSPVQRVAPVYTDFRQKHVTVNGLVAGDVLEASIVTVIHTALAPGHFWTEYRFNTQAIVLDEQLEIDIPASRPVILKQQAGVAAKTTTADGRTRYQWTHANIVRKKPEDANATTPDADEDTTAPVRLTSFADWAAVGAWFGGLERQARAPSPEVAAKARELIAGRTADLEKLEALYDYVSKSFRYVSLSLGMGRYQPRRAADVMREAYGDCKDKHTLLAALIDAAGLEASPVLMNSAAKIDPDFPSPSQFDHMITLARAGGQEVWLDATSGVAPFRMLAYELRGKDGLVATSSTGTLKTAPAEIPGRTLARTEVRGTLAENGTLSADVRLTFRGDTELLLRNVFHATPKANWEEVISGISREAGLAGRVSAVSVSEPQATNDAFSLGFHVDVEGYASIAGRRTDLALPFAEADREDGAPPESKPIELGQPGEISYVLTLKMPAAARARAAVPVSVSRDYGEYRATYSVEGDTVRVQREFTVKQRELPQSRRADYLSFKRVLTADAKQRIAIDGTAIATPAVASDAKAPALIRSGYDALENREYDKAIDLLKRALALDPKVANGRLYLGQAHLGRNDPNAALEVLRAQTEQNPYDEYAYFWMGRAYVALRQFDAAEKAYKKQLENDPLDKFTPGELGRMYLNRREYAKAAEMYEKATVLNPDQSYAHTQLGKAYLHLQRRDDAMTAFGRAIELAPNASTWNSIAYELALAGVDLSRAQRYAESAVASQSAASRDLDVNRADTRALRMAGSLSSYWDTLGWVHFANGDPAAAEKYVAAAWSIDQDAEVGDHLGQIYEKTGRKDAAIAAYARALSADDPDPMVREHLLKLAGDASKVEGLIADHRADLAAVRTFTLEGKGPRGKTADFLVLFATPGTVEAVRFVEGDEEMRALVPALQKLKPFAFPESTPAKLLRRGIAGCDAGGACRFTLLLQADAQPVK